MMRLSNHPQAPPLLPATWLPNPTSPALTFCQPPVSRERSSWWTVSINFNTAAGAIIIIIITIIIIIIIIIKNEIE